ncbi:MAG: hypothetical protein IKS64_01445, partial [Muribaculaceae bacterium]|nr:hypothetical protein [Muribaculaceae bacterium]
DVVRDHPAGRRPSRPWDERGKRHRPRAGTLPCLTLLHHPRYCPDQNLPPCPHPCPEVMLAVLAD